MNLMPWTPAYNEDGTVLITSEGDAEHNIVRNINSAQNEYRYYGVNMSSYAEITILPWLKWRTNLGAQYRNSREGSFTEKIFLILMDLILQLLELRTIIRVRICHGLWRTWCISIRILKIYIL